MSMPTVRDAPHLPFFDKPKSPTWAAFNEARHAASVNRAIDATEGYKERRKLAGFPSLKATKCTKVRFGRLPLRKRADAERELNRLVNRHIQRTGHPPSRAKLA